MAKVKTAKIKKAKKAKQSTQLPLDDMRWRPVSEIVEKLLPHIGNKVLIARDLTEALASKKIRCMRRHTNEHTLKVEKLSDAELDAIVSGKAAGEMDQPAGHGQLLPASFWIDHYLAYSSNGDIRVAFRLPPNHHGPSGDSFTLTANWVFYLWQPDCVKEWPVLAPQAVAAGEAEANDPSSLHRRRGPKPRWQLFIAAKLYELMEAGKQIPTASELDQLCEIELGHQPGESAINKWLKKLPI
jgi:hypothetical protein